MMERNNSVSELFIIKEVQDCVQLPRCGIPVEHDWTRGTREKPNFEHSIGDKTDDLSPPPIR